MTPQDREEPRCDEGLLTGAVVTAGTPDRLLALAWARLADPLAPPGTVRANRILVLRAVSVHGGNH